MTGQLTQRSFVVFVYDRNGVSIPRAKIEVVVGNSVLATATTTGFSNAPIHVETSPNIKTVTLRASVEGQEPQDQTVDIEVHNVTFTFSEVVMPQKVPGWFPKAGYISGAATLAFFMYVAAVGIEKPTFAHHAVLALGVALASAFIGGDAAAKGNLPIPLVRESPVAFSVAGGIAAFVITMLLSNALWR